MSLTDIGETVMSGFMAVFLLMGLPSFADIDPENIMGMWLFDEGKGGVATDSWNREMMAKSMARNG